MEIPNIFGVPSDQEVLANVQRIGYELPETGSSDYEEALLRHKAAMMKVEFPNPRKDALAFALGTPWKNN